MAMSWAPVRHPRAVYIRTASAGCAGVIHARTSWQHTKLPLERPGIRGIPQKLSHRTLTSHPSVIPVLLLLSHPSKRLIAVCLSFWLSSFYPSLAKIVLFVDFERFLSGRSYKYRCLLCHGRSMNEIESHKNLPNHKSLVAAQEAIDRENEQHLGSFLQNDNNDRSNTEPAEADHQEEFPDDYNKSPEPEGYTEALMKLLTGNYSNSESEDSDSSQEARQHLKLENVDWNSILIQKLQEDADQSSTTSESHQSSDSDMDNEAIEEPSKQNTPRIDTDWYPFTKEVVGLLSLGSGRHLASESEYEHNRMLFGIFNITLPAYRTLGRLQKRMCARLGFNVNVWESALRNPCYGLSIKEIVAQELANPTVTKHLTFIPEYEPNQPTNRLSQSKKWREGFSRNQRLQMVPSTKGHLFLYKPICQASGGWIVPVFFFQQSGKIYAKCLKASIVSQGDNSSNIKIIVNKDQNFDSLLLITVDMDTIGATFIDSKDSKGILLKGRYGGVMYQHDGDGYCEIPLPNPWRIKSNGEVIRHVPLTIYSDDTSGNVSKKWNKHMSYYFTLLGLPPGMTNQEYNIHFLSTLNKAGALELGENLVTELNMLGQDGFTTYDKSLKEDVLVMVVPLCHLGDSPMHAKITNTTNPSVTLNPCRICTLGVETLTAKKDAKYTRAFVGLHQDKGGPQPREWETTKSQTYELWELLQNPKKHTEFRRKSKEYGVKDTTNTQFVEHFHELHQDHKYSKEEVHKMFKDLNDQFGDRLFNPFLHLAGFEGHLDTPVESLHVVLLGVVKYLFRDAMDNLPDSALPSVLARWKSFDTSGLNVPTIQPRTLTSYYQSLVGKDFQTILQSIPSVLYPHFSYERRRMWTALVHLGSYIFQAELTNMCTYLTNLKKLVNIFLGHLIRWTAQWTNKPKFHMLVHLVHSIDRFGPLSLVATQKFESFNGTITAPGTAPSELTEAFPKHSWSPKKESILASKQRVRLRNFVLLDLKSKNSPRVGRVESFWEGTLSKSVEHLVNIKICDVSTDIDEFYGFCGLTVSQEDLWIPLKTIQCVLNIQHNCNLAKCQPQKSPQNDNGQLPLRSPYQIQHEVFNGYLINSGALYSAEFHRSIADIKYQAWSVEEWEECIHKGMESWKSTQEKKEKLKQDQMNKTTKYKEKENAAKRKHVAIDQPEDIDVAGHIDPALV
ncbi:hypothetical protein DFH28DRAFT_927727 [Melampsora americana]|nr:hypothetical protein DFH28DRAFT_927727 [Melampsora americana]